MREVRIAIAEEALADALMHDLGDRQDVLPREERFRLPRPTQVNSTE